MKTVLISFKTAQVDGCKIFYREAGDPTAQAVLLLQGFPTSSHVFRNLIPQLADHYHVVAPDLPGFGFSDAPDHKSFESLRPSGRANWRLRRTNQSEKVCRLRLRLWCSGWIPPRASQSRAHLGADIPQSAEIQLDLIGDYKSNVAQYLRFLWMPFLRVESTHKKNSDS